MLRVQASNAVDSQVPVVLDSLTGRNMILSLRKRPGRETEDVLDSPGKPEGVRGLLPVEQCSLSMG